MRIIALCLSGLIAAGVLASAGTASALPQSVTRQQCYDGGGYVVFEQCMGGRYAGQDIIPGT